MKSSFVKKFLSLVLASVMILTLVACGSKPSDNNNNTDSTAFPTKTMTIVCPYGAGGGTDLALRILAECGKDTFGQTINVENKTGGSGTVGLTEALNAAADGYTLGTCSVDLITLPLLGLAPAETTRDAFDPICVINGEPAAIIIRADSRWNTIQDFLAEAKEKPGTVQLANSGMGDIWHLAAIGIELETGASFNHVPFDGAASALTAVLGGCAMLLTCFLLSDGVRLFHAVFFIGGIALTHLLLTPSRKKKRKRIDGTDEDALPALPTPAEDERASDASAPHPSSGSSDRA